MTGLLGRESRSNTLIHLRAHRRAHTRAHTRATVGRRRESGAEMTPYFSALTFTSTTC